MQYDYKTLQIANFFIEKAIEENSNFSLTPLKLIKLIYIAHGWSLALYNEPLINDPIQAWPYGPVIENVYRAVKKYGDQPITDPILVEFGEDEDGNPIKMEMKIDEHDNHTKKLLEKIWQTYKKYSGIQLANWTHSENGPWFKTWHNNGRKTQKSIPIPNEVIKEYFLRLSENESHGR